MLSAFVLSVGLLAVTALIASSMRHSMENRDAIIASELAQEGVELIRNIRDNDFAAGNDGFSTGFSTSRRHCHMSYNSSSMTCTATQGGSSRYYLQLSGGHYSHASSTQRFSRYIYIDYDNGQKTAEVKSFVYWNWTSSSMPSYVPRTGNTANCTLVNKCVYTEAFLTSWR
ncbi:MAG: hypothetical protein A2808_00255 [Candidatus Moranbacteria bacterium RIFCSPHIGHO2_01_FULL_55_24]|nr:MAG: hypothetical protein A2808_00255 [Candidatus Moranbacteria bacterium RIFCSPHIGHO2_01_FULL_55_24]